MDDPGDGAHRGVRGAERGVGPAVLQRQQGVGARRLGERGPVQRGEALGVGERPALRLHGHDAGRLDVQPPVGGVAQVHRNNHLLGRAERGRERERNRVGAGRRDRALEVDDPGDGAYSGVGRAERGVGPAVLQRERGEGSRRLGERGAVQRGEALGVGERVALGLDGHDPGGLDEQPPVGGVAQIHRDVDRRSRAEPRRQGERNRVGAGRRDRALELHDPGDGGNLGAGRAERGVGPAIQQRERGERGGLGCGGAEELQGEHDRYGAQCGGGFTGQFSHLIAS